MRSWANRFKLIKGIFFLFSKVVFILKGEWQRERKGQRRIISALVNSPQRLIAIEKCALGHVVKHLQTWFSLTIKTEIIIVYSVELLWELNASYRGKTPMKSNSITLTINIDFISKLIILFSDGKWHKIPRSKGTNTHWETVHGDRLNAG